MAESLSDFFETFYCYSPRLAVRFYYPSREYHDIDRQIERNLRKVIIRVAHGPYAPAMRELAQRWRIDPADRRAPAHARLKAAMLAHNPPPLTYVTTVVTRIRKELEELLWRQCPTLCVGSIHARRAARHAAIKQRLQAQGARRMRRFEERESKLFAEFRK